MTVTRKRRKVKRKGKVSKRRKSPSGSTTLPPRRPPKRKPPKRPPKKKPQKKKRRTRKQNSESAKKGWVTRRQRQLGDATLAEQQDFLRRPEVQRQLVDDIIRTGLADRVTPEQLILPGMVKNTETLILSALVLAKQFGTFDERARELASEFNWDLREVYTLYHSP